MNMVLTDDTDRGDRTDSDTVLMGTRQDTRDQHDACLVIIRGARLGSRIVLAGNPVVVGRSVDADFQISDRSISRRHFRVYHEGSGYWIEDLESTNMTFLNDEPVSRAPLRDGDHVRVSKTVLKFVDEDNIEAGYHSELHESTIRDALTGLYNRRHAMAVLRTETAKAQRDGSRVLSIVILDLDFFKEINDEFGHLAGDGVLKQLGEITADRVRASDTLARIGGEEFLLILPDTTSEDAVQIAESIRLAVASETYRIEGEERKITISGGVASWQQDMESMSDLLKTADEQLYQAKSTGRNRVC